MYDESSKPRVLEFAGTLEGHDGWVTRISTCENRPELLVSASRDKSLIIWNLDSDSPNNVGVAKKSLTGHNGPIQDVVISSDGLFGVSASWDKTLRLWDFTLGKTVRKFNGHSSDVFAVAFSHDNRQIVSAGRDKIIKLWNTVAECKFNLIKGQHMDWVSCVKFSPDEESNTIVSAGWDGLVKVWDLTKCMLKFNLKGHTGPVHSVTISPDGTLCASGGKGGTAMLWDIEKGESLFALENNSDVLFVCFSPEQYWLCCVCHDFVTIWDLEHKVILEKIESPFPTKSNLPWATCANWDAKGRKLFVGAVDNKIYCYNINTAAIAE